MFAYGSVFVQQILTWIWGWNSELYTWTQILLEVFLIAYSDFQWAWTSQIFNINSCFSGEKQAVLLWIKYGFVKIWKSLYSVFKLCILPFYHFQNWRGCIYGYQATEIYTLNKGVTYFHMPVAQFLKDSVEGGFGFCSSQCIVELPHLILAGPGSLDFVVASGWIKPCCLNSSAIGITKVIVWMSLDLFLSRSAEYFSAVRNIVWNFRSRRIKDVFMDISLWVNCKIIMINSPSSSISDRQRLPKCKDNCKYFIFYLYYIFIYLSMYN